MTVLLFRWLVAHGWETTLLQRILNDATAKVETKYPFANTRDKGKPQ